MDERTGRNVLRARVLIAGFAAPLPVLVIVIGLVTGMGLLGLLLGILLALGGVAVLHGRSAAAVLAMTGARPVNEADHARYHNLVDGLCVSWGLPEPRLYVVDDEVPDACAIGRDPADASIVATSGLLATMNRVELEGVLAYELARIRSRDPFPGTVAAVTVGRLARAAEGAASGSGSPFGRIARLFSSPLARLLHYASPVQDQHRADIAAVRLTRYPPGLISALEQSAAAGGGERPVDRATAHLWMVGPQVAATDGSRRAEVAAAFDVHPPLHERIERLREL